MVGPMVAMLFPPPFTPFNLGERCVGIAGGFRLFTGGGTGGADRLPEGEGIARGGTPRVWVGSGPGRKVCGEVVSYIPIESLRMGCGTGGRSCVGGVSFEPDRLRLYLDELFDAMVMPLGKLLELSVLALRIAFPLERSSIVGGRRFSTLLVDFNDLCLVGPGLNSWLSDVGPGLSSRVRSTTGVEGIGVTFLSWTHQSPPRHRSTRRFVVGLISRILALPTRDSKASIICERLYGVERSCVLVSRG